MCYTHVHIAICIYIYSRVHIQKLAACMPPLASRNTSHNIQNNATIQIANHYNSPYYISAMRTKRNDKLSTTNNYLYIYIRNSFINKSEYYI